MGLYAPLGSLFTWLLCLQTSKKSAGEYLTHIFDFFSFSRKLPLSNLEFWISIEMNVLKILHYWLRPKVSAQGYGPRKNQILYDSFMKLFDFSRKLTSQIWYCELDGDNGSPAWAAIHKVLHKNFSPSKKSIFDLSTVFENFLNNLENYPAIS